MNERASFQFVISPLNIAELVNEKDMLRCWRRIKWVLDALDTWLITLEDTGDRESEGGTVRHRFKLTTELQEFERRLMEISDFSRDPLDRLLLVQYKMGSCDAFMTTDENTIWRHRKELLQKGIKVLKPKEFWELISPFAKLWY